MTTPDNQTFYQARETVRRFCEENPQLCQPVMRESRSSGEEHRLLDFSGDLVQAGGSVSFNDFRRAVETMLQCAGPNEKRRIHLRPGKVIVMASTLQFLTDMEPFVLHTQAGTTRDI